MLFRALRAKNGERVLDGPTNRLLPADLRFLFGPRARPRLEHCALHLRGQRDVMDLCEQNPVARYRVVPLGYGGLQP